MDYYRIEKQRLAVLLTLIGGGSLRGHIFVQRSAAGHPGGETPMGVFNGSDPFLPLEVETGEVVLVAKDRVAEVSGVAPAVGDELRRASARSMQLEVRLAGGAVRAGSVTVELPSTRARPLDFLNHHGLRFLTLYDADGVRLINTRQIDTVRPLD